MQEDGLLSASLASSLLAPQAAALHGYSLCFAGDEDYFAGGAEHLAEGDPIASIVTPLLSSDSYMAVAEEGAGLAAAAAAEPTAASVALATGVADAGLGVHAEVRFLYLVCGVCGKAATGFFFPSQV